MDAIKTKAKMSQLHADEAPLTFNDVAAWFSEKEWKLLDKWQKEVYNNVMKELHQALISLGPLIATSIFSIRAPINEDPTLEDHQLSETIYEIECNTKHASTTSFESAVIKEEEDEIHCMDIQLSDRTESINRPADISHLNVKSLDEHQYAEEEESHIGLSSGSSFFNTDIVVEEEDEEPEQLSKASVIEHTVSPSSAYFGRKRGRKAKMAICLKNTRKPMQYGTSPETSNKKEYQCPPKQQYSRSSACLENTMERQSQSATEYGSSFCVPTQSSLHQENSKDKCEKYDCESNLMEAKDLTFQPMTENMLGSIMINECEEIPSAKRNLIAHIRKNTQEKNLHCTKCGKSFSQSKNLSRHQRTHKGEKKKPYYCTVCEKSFSQKHHLVTHMRIHTGERPYKCTECNRTFTVESNLITHYRLHSGDRPFQCTECEKCFSQKSHLIAHVSKHTGVKPFQCTECEKSFNSKRSLVRHQSTHCY